MIKVFIASPRDLATERRHFKDIVDSLNQGFGRGADVEFVPLGWEDALAQVGRRPQSIINEDVDRCDLFLLLMWRRWGQEAPDAGPYSSYTEEEFYRALARYEKHGSPAIFVLLKHIDPDQMADPGPQLSKVLAFRKKLEETRKVLYRTFIDAQSFASEVDKHLVAFAKGEITLPNSDSRAPLLPDSVIQEIENLRKEARVALERAEKAESKAKTKRAREGAAAKLDTAKATGLALELAERAAKAALEGKIEEARQGFVQALDGTTNLDVLNLGYQFFYRIGELNEAERLVYRWLATSGPRAVTAETASAYNNLGNIYKTRGELSQSEQTHRRALDIHVQLDGKEGMAETYGHLGNIYRTRDELDTAEDMFKLALEIYQGLKSKEGIARCFAFLGNIYETREATELAEEMYLKALDLNRECNRLEGMARNFGNLGSIYKKQNRLDEAEKMHQEALAINKLLGRLEGVASNYNNLGVLYESRMQFDEAETMHQSALAINKQLGRLEGMGRNHGNLGNILEARGDFQGAIGQWKIASELFERVGIPKMVETTRALIDDIQMRLNSKPTN